MGVKHVFKNIYENHYKKIMFIPFLLLFLAIVQIASQYAATGEFVHRGIGLKGGSTITLQTSIDVPDLDSYLQEKFPGKDISVRTISSTGKIVGLAIDSEAEEQKDIDSLIASLKEKGLVEKGNYSIEIVGSTLGSSFFKQIVVALAVAFILMGIVVFVYFHVPVPSLAVILAAVSDITVTLSIFNLTGIKLSSAGIAAFLMLIGYSVDTDILLTSRVLKRKEGTVMERIYGAITTGLTMTFTTLAAVLVALIFVQSDVIKQIMLILFIGLLVDMIMTWIQNVGILRLYLEKKEKEKIHHIH